MKLRLLPLIMTLITALAFTSCASKKSKPSEEVATDSEDMASLELEVNADSDSGRAGMLKTVYFPYDSAKITFDTKVALENNANFLKKLPNLNIQIEGHCDERGGVQYNMALGEKRARSIKNFLVARGIASERISTISFGKERPLEFGHSEAAWSRNRRGNFVVTSF